MSPGLNPDGFASCPSTLEMNLSVSYESSDETSSFINQTDNASYHLNFEDEDLENNQCIIKNLVSGI